MKRALASMLFVALCGRWTNAQQESDVPSRVPMKQADDPERSRENTKKGADDADDEDLKESKLAVLSEEELNRLLDRRVNGQLGMTFGGFLKIFLVQSHLSVGTGIALITDDRKIIRSELQPTFPQTYHPTLRELMDSIALELRPRKTNCPNRESRAETSRRTCELSFSTSKTKEAFQRQARRGLEDRR